FKYSIQLEPLPRANTSGIVNNSGLSDAQKKHILFIHNHIRSVVHPLSTNMIKLKWEPLLETIATRYVEKCTLVHNTNRHNEYRQASELSGIYLKPNNTWIGENIAWGVGNCSTSEKYVDCGDVFEGLNR
ncbi:hypothetical protein MXB_1614, partial [Myxobolus squamalis]